MRVRAAMVLAGAAALAALASGCGGSNSMNMTASTPVTPDRTVVLQAKNVKFLPDKLTIPMGSVVELKLENMDATEHDVQVDGMDASVMSGGAMSAGHGGAQMVAVHTKANMMGSVVFKANKKGTYNFYCTISGHKESGMVGTLTVE